MIKPSFVVRWGQTDKRTRKSVLKYYGIGLLVSFILIGVFTPKSSNTKDTTASTKVEDTATKDTATNQETKTDTTTKKDEPKQEEKKSNVIKSGTYKVGSDIPAGEYLVISKSMGYMECTKDSKGQLDSILFNDNLTSGSNSYVTLNEGEYFKLTGAEMYPVAEAPSIIPKDGIYKDGMYKVGQDIPAGEYKVKLTGGIGYTEVSQNSRHQLDSIVSNENVQADGYLTVENGQYLKISGVQIQK